MASRATRSCLALSIAADREQMASFLGRHRGQMAALLHRAVA
jgi:hypothetical protein